MSVNSERRRRCMQKDVHARWRGGNTQERNVGRWTAREACTEEKMNGALKDAVRNSAGRGTAC